MTGPSPSSPRDSGPAPRSRPTIPGTPHFPSPAYRERGSGGEGGTRYIAVDLGAESGRVVAGTLRDERIVLEEVHRFANVPVRTPDGLHWDILRLFRDVQDGLRAVAHLEGPPPVALGVDSWGVDFGLLDAGGRLLGNPYHYRDARTDGLNALAAQIVPAQEQYARTGIAQLPFNTLYQLMALTRAGDDAAELATTLLLIPDLLHYWLSGEVACEYTNASTSGALGVDGAWATDLLKRLGAPSHMLLPPMRPGFILGELREAVREECGLGPVAVVLPATHDTGSAVVAVPARSYPEGRTHAYISSGTWSLLGLELDRPILSEEARLAGFTNEGGAGGTYRFLTNIMGLWLVQECRRAWTRAGLSWSYEELAMRAAALPAPRIALDVDDRDFLHPPDMPVAIRAQLARRGLPALEQPEALTRVILEGLALKYRVALERAERLSGLRAEAIHIVGGGARNAVLCQFTADACGRPVLAGPVEATALGNMLVQAIGRGELADLAAARHVARRSAEIVSYEPRDRAYWDELHGQLEQT